MTIIVQIGHVIGGTKWIFYQDVSTFTLGKTRKKGVLYTIIRQTNFFFFDDITSILTYIATISQVHWLPYNNEIVRIWKLKLPQSIWPICADIYFGVYGILLTPLNTGIHTYIQVLSYSLIIGCSLSNRARC